MHVLNLDRATKVRQDARGTLWRHVKCLWCHSRGAGVDRGAHLGIGLRGHLPPKVHCFRCGLNALPLGTQLIFENQQDDARQFRLPVMQSVTATNHEHIEAQDHTPGVPLIGMPRTSSTAKIVTRKLLSKWKGLRYEDLCRGGVHVGDEGLDTVYLPYWTPKGWGYQCRFLDADRKGKIKVKTVGPKGVAFLQEQDLTQPRDWVVVEGWADACAVPPPFEPCILQGLSNWQNLRGTVTLALDRDQPGRRACKKRIISLMKKGVKVFVADDYEAADPGDAGRQLMLKSLTSRTPIETIEDFFAWSERKLCLSRK